MSGSIVAVTTAPAVNDDPNSLESKMAVQAKQLEMQSVQDAKYDPVYKREGFMVYQADYNQTSCLLGVTALCLVILASFIKKRK
jgi:hypothetical protein